MSRLLSHGHIWKWKEIYVDFNHSNVRCDNSNTHSNEGLKFAALQRISMPLLHGVLCLCVMIDGIMPSIIEKDQLE